MSERPGALTTTEVALDVLRSNRALLGLDFDGTMSEIVVDPPDAEPYPGVVDSLGSIAQYPTTDVVVISGRPLSDLKDRLGNVSGLQLIGEHGNDVGGPGSKRDPDVEAAEAFVRRQARNVGGAFVESKAHSVAFHYRNAEAEPSERVIEQIQAYASQSSLSVLHGKKVIELSVGTETKGSAVSKLAGHDKRIVYIGDDVTDETVFDVLKVGDVGIKVGPGETNAEHRLPNVAAVAELLDQVVMALRR